MREMTREEFLEHLFQHIRRTFRRQKVAAKHYGCSDSMISAIVNGRKPPTKAMLQDLGVVREITKVEVYKLNN